MLLHRCYIRVQLLKIQLNCVGVEFMYCCTLNFILSRFLAWNCKKSTPKIEGWVKTLNFSKQIVNWTIYRVIISEPKILHLNTWSGYVLPPGTLNCYVLLLIKLIANRLLAIAIFLMLVSSLAGVKKRNRTIKISIEVS